MFTNLDAQFLSDLATAYTEAALAAAPLPVIDNATAARLRRIAENLQRMDQVDAYDRGFAAGRAYLRSRSNVEPLPKSEVRRVIADAKTEVRKVTKRVVAETRTYNVDLKGLGL